MEHEKHPHTIHYKVDDEPQETTERELSANDILSKAGIDSATHYLVELEGHHRKSYEGKGTEAIHMHDHMVFISVSVEPTPVSN